MVVGRGSRERGMGKLVFNGYGVSVGEEEKVLEMYYCGDNSVKVLNAPELCN